MRTVQSTHANDVPTFGAIDRAYAGLVSGWLHCTDCPTGHADLVLRVDKNEQQGRLTVTPRPDVPGGTGFMMRFIPEVRSNASPVAVSIECAWHVRTAIRQLLPIEDWQVPALGKIENVAWPIVNGWLAIFEASDRRTRLEIAGFQGVDVQPSVSRPDVQTFLGADGVAGFHVDLGGALGYAVPNGSIIRLTRGGVDLHSVNVQEVPMGDLIGTCIPLARNELDELDEACIQQLAHRFRVTEMSPQGGDWLEILQGLGIQDHSAASRQWAQYLAHQGLGEDEVAGWLARRAIQQLRVPALDPLPADLAERLRQVPSQSLPERARAWADGLLLVDPLASESSKLGGFELHTDGSEVVDSVCVAGLVHHKSGLGQNANYSIRALEAEGFHACAEPFFPAPGGWNPRLGPSSKAADVMRNHAVLLHLPIDRVVQSLSAQPALLASPRLIGYFMWETGVVPRQLHRGLALVDEIWTATHFVANAFRAVTNTPVRVTGHAVDVSGVERVTRAELGIAEDAFVVHFSFDANSTVARKNPNAAIDAFRRAFGDDPTALFILKVRNMQQAEYLARQGDPHALGMLARLRDDRRIRLITGEWSHGRSLGLLQLADCFISLHRSEGFGYAIAEAMALGTPVVATDYSGSSDFLSTFEGWPVEYELVDVLPEEYFYWEPGMKWASANMDSAAAHLQNVRVAAGASERPQRAASQMTDLSSTAMLGRRYRLELSTGLRVGCESP